MLDFIKRCLGLELIALLLLAIVYSFSFDGSIVIGSTVCLAAAVVCTVCTLESDWGAILAIPVVTFLIWFQFLMLQQCWVDARIYKWILNTPEAQQLFPVNPHEMPQIEVVTSFRFACEQKYNDSSEATNGDFFPAVPFDKAYKDFEESFKHGGDLASHAIPDHVANTTVRTANTTGTGTSNPNGNAPKSTNDEVPTVKEDPIPPMTHERLEELWKLPPLPRSEYDRIGM